MYGCGKDCLILIPFRVAQISCFTLSLKYFSSASDNCPDVGIGPLLQFPNSSRAGPVPLTLLFLPLVPSSYQVLRHSIYSFPLVRYSCSLSSGVLHAFQCLKVYPRCIHGEMHSRSTYSSAILFSPLTCILKSISLDLQALQGPLRDSKSYVPSEFLPKVCQRSK